MGDGFVPRSPTHLIKVKEKDGAGITVVGRAWLNADGSMSIQLNPCVQISWHDNVHITAFPCKKGPKDPTSEG